MQTINIPDFTNTAPLDFSNPDDNVQGKIDEAIALIRKTMLGARYPLLIHGKGVWSEKTFARENPSKTNEIIGNVDMATTDHVGACIEKLQHSKVLQEWSTAPVEYRAKRLRWVADKFREKRFFFIALTILETGKSAPEADGEICEAIDFLEWYAAYAPFVVELCNKTLISPCGEKNSAEVVPATRVPICASIQPWNFPVAISVGPAAAALVSGYAVLYKPSQQSSVIGYHMVKTFLDAGIPPALLHFLPGSGKEIGTYMVKHRQVSAVAFTGSKKVRDEIQYDIAEFNKNEIPRIAMRDRYQKQALALESGGKNAIIVDSDADMDEAVVGISDSTFGFQGQKCSACSRLIIVDKDGIHGEVYKAITSRLKDRMKSMRIGNAEDPKNQIGPLIDINAYNKFNTYLDTAKGDECVVTTRVIPSASHSHGYFVPPTIVEQLHPYSKIAQEEIFGPLLSVFSALSFEDAIHLANASEFALTAGIYSRNEDNIALAKRMLIAGNIYINHKITGAVVGKQPFGGFKMSGNGTKAGGWDYLLSFLLQQKNITENTMRRGIPLE